jgi:hypothetical protein
MDETKNGNIFTIEVQLIQDDEFEDFSLASKNLNPLLTYVRFVLTDDQPNANGVRIPREEFSNLIRSGLYMPIKMAVGKIEDGHDGSTPLGVITHLRETDSTIRGVAALWNKERPADIALIKERYAEGRPLDLSWEIGFEDYVEDEAGVKNLRGCILRATTLVGMPAYGSGRTSITDVELSEEDKSKEDTKVDEKELQRLQEENTSLKATIAELEAGQLTEEQKEKLAQYDELVEFKETVVAEAARIEKLEEIKQKFSEAGIEKDDDYFVENESALLAMDDTDTLDFFISNLAETEASREEDEQDGDEDDEEQATVKVPPITKKQKPDEKLTGSQLAEALRQAKRSDN